MNLQNKLVETPQVTLSVMSDVKDTISFTT